MSILTLLTDFGLSDGYVGIMKGVVAQVNPLLKVIDLSHQIQPQSIAAARFVLMTAYPYFPAGTVHVVVVDPGVGGTRRAIALSIGPDPLHPSGFLVGPDNGLFSGVLSQHPVLAAVELSNSQYWGTVAPSHTFHGRDIFAPVGAYLASGVSLERLGRAIAPETLMHLNFPALQLEKIDGTTSKIMGHIQAVDHFGNLVTNIPEAEIDRKDWFIKIGDQIILSKQTYSDSVPGELLAIVGSHSFLEIAVNGGNAQTRLRLEVGETVQVFAQET